MATRSQARCQHSWLPWHPTNSAGYSSSNSGSGSGFFGLQNRWTDGPPPIPDPRDNWTHHHEHSSNSTWSCRSCSPSVRIPKGYQHQHSNREDEHNPEDKPEDEPEVEDHHDRNPLGIGEDSSGPDGDMNEDKLAEERQRKMLLLWRTLSETTKIKASKKKNYKGYVCLLIEY